MQYFRGTIAGGGLNKKPLDPLKNTEYGYSSLAEGKSYQLRAEYEGDLAQNAMDAGFLAGTAHAEAGNPTVAYVRGNFGGLVAKAVTGSTTYVLAVPSILTSSGSSGTPVAIGSLSGTLVFNGKALRGGSTFAPGQAVFTGSKLPGSDANSEITNMMAALKAIYAASDIQSNQNVAALLGTSSGSLKEFGTSVVTAQLAGSVGTSGNSGNGAACGTANGTTVTVAPVAGVATCSNGTLSGSVTGTGPWNWTCANGATTASCSALAPLFAFASHTFTNCGTT
jgi:hypothetical protein